MIRKALQRTARFKQAEDGSLTVEFVILFPLYMFFILGAIEYAMVSIQQSMLERSVDLVVRDIRLGTGSGPTHDSIKDAICSRSSIINNCSANLRLEMVVQDPYAGINIDPTVDCVDRAEPAKPVREFSNGGSNELMVLRACAKVNPILATTTFGRALTTDDGLVTLTATTAFVQEP